tara:strand:- start:78 stop:491 length:414 start_codon:yes stop_codon:yes gene_type:complete
MSESEEQSNLIEWAASQENIYPELKLLYAIPNQGGAGKAAIIRGQRMRREGMRKGIPDLCLPVSRGNFLTLYIEMKFGKGRLSPEQAQWISLLSSVGHNCQVCHSFEEGVNTLINYLSLNNVIGDSGGNSGPKFTYD